MYLRQLRALNLLGVSMEYKRSFDKLPLILIMFFLLLPNSLFAEQKIRVGIYENMPKVFTSGSGKPSGIFVDIIEEIARREGWLVEYIRGSWGEGLDRLEKGEIDFLPDVAFTQERNSLFLFHQEPVLFDWFQIYAKTGSRVRSVIDLDDKKVSIVERSIQEEALKKMLQAFGLSVTIIFFPDYSEAFAAVIEGWADAAVTNRFFGARHAQKYGLEDTAIVFNPISLFFAASRKVAPEILKALDKNLADMKHNQDSIYYKSLRKWATVDHEPVIPSWLKNLLIGLVFMSLFGGLGVFTLKHHASSQTDGFRKSLKARGGSNKLWETTFNAVQDAIWVIDAESNILLANPATSKLFGVDAKTFITGRKYLEVRKKFEKEHQSCSLESVRFEKKRISSIAPLGEKWIKVTVDPILDEMEKVRGFIHIVSDITEVKRAEMDMAVKEQKIRAINKELEDKISELKMSREQTIQVLARVNESRDPYTAGHQRRVAKLAVAIAEEMRLGEEKAKEIELASLIHDTGKIQIPSEILSKPGTLSPVEFALIKTHPETALRILKPVQFNWPLAETVYQHHERMDGSGYPRGIKGNDILLEARILAIADTV